LKREHLISYRFAVVVISILLAASAAGWILTELIPPDFPQRIQIYRERWGDTAARLIDRGNLYDPFHSVWYRAVLALFLSVLTTCLVTRWKQFLQRSLRITVPDREEPLRKRRVRTEIELPRGTRGTGASGPGVETSPSDDPLMEKTRRFLRRRGYAVRVERREGVYFFAAVAGRWRFLGNFLFHLGILVITVGAVIGSFWGRSGFVYGTIGDKLPLPGSRDSVLVEDFRILTTDRDEIRDYISTVAIVNGDDDTLLAGDIEVNHPLRYGGLNIYQSSYFVAENEFVSAVVSLSRGGEQIDLKRGNSIALAERGLSIEPGRFIPDFRMGPEGPYSASPSLQNPALEIEIKGMGRVERGWLFLNHPRFNSKFDFPVSPILVEIEPLYYTGLQVSYNPGEHVLMAGILLGTVGLVLLYIFDHRVIGGMLDGERLLVAGLEYRWKVGFGEEFDSISTELRRISSHGEHRDGGAPTASG
jgi:cytochrome c biogenesis protein